jgi:hypothetical protein
LNGPFHLVIDLQNRICGKPDEGLSTRCGGQDMVLFYVMAKRVRSPQIGPPRGF